jgi:hypothetical protein
VFDEVADHLDIDVGFEQREPDLTQRLFDIALGDSSLALVNRFRELGRTGSGVLGGTG